MKKVLIIVCVACIILSSCTTYKFRPIADDGITLRNNRGDVYPYFINDDVEICIVPSYIESDIALKITVLNKEIDLLQLSDTDFELYNSNDGYLWQKMEVYTSEKYYSKEKTEYTVGAVLMVLSAASSSASAGYGSSNTYGTYNGNTRYGSYSGSYYSRTTYYDPTAAQIAQQRNQENVNNYARNGQQWLDFLKENLFYSTDLQKGYMYYGIVFGKSGDGKFYKVKFNNQIIGDVVIKYEKVAEE
jgi:hypothetical protein